MRLTDSHKVISMVIPEQNGFLLTVCENGYGKRTSVDEFPTKGRGGKGMIAIQASDRNGPLVGATQLFAGDEIMLISDQGTMVRTRGDEVSVVGRNTQGVRIIRLKETEKLVSLARIAEPEEDEFVEVDSNLDSSEVAPAKN
jgi:DNA gyrase subunit A